MRAQPGAVSVHPVAGLPEIRTGADIAGLVVERLEEPLRPYDVVVVTSKVVSKAAGLVVTGAREELVEEATDRLVARKGMTRIVRTKAGLTMAAGGLDESNTEQGTVVVLPPEPDADASALRARLSALCPEVAERLGVVVTDTAGRAWRVGQTDLAIGVAGIRPLRSYAGAHDQYGNELRVTEPAVADEIAGAADLAAGKLARVPVAVVRGLDPALFTSGDGPGAAALIRDEAEDLFGLGAHQAVLDAIASTTGRPRGFPDTGVDAGELVGLALEATDDRKLAITTDDDVPIRVRVAPAHDTDAAEAAVAYGGLVERLRVLGRAFGVEVRYERLGPGPLPAVIVVGDG